MIFQAKLRKIGTSLGIIIPRPRDIIRHYNAGDFVAISLEEKNIISSDAPVVLHLSEEQMKPTYSLETVEDKVKASQLAFCKKHVGSLKITCGCP